VASTQNKAHFTLENIFGDVRLNSYCAIKSFSYMSLWRQKKITLEYHESMSNSSQTVAPVAVNSIQRSATMTKVKNDTIENKAKGKYSASNLHEYNDCT
jgi:hypothetical protein